MSETPGERLDRMARATDGVDWQALVQWFWCVENNTPITDYELAGIDRLARAFLASYGVEVPE
jgi:hypothetical protein